jgi:hypothetical protein
MPRRLPNNPYLEPSTSGMLGRQIENAAEASVEFGRVLGIVYFDLGASPSGAFDGERGDWDAERDELMAEFKQALRPTDHVALLSDREIVACIALLPGRTELLGIAGRLRAIGQNSVRFASAFAAEAGLSIFPACGYRGEELIDYARADYRARKPAVLAPRPFRLRLVEDLAERKA